MVTLYFSFLISLFLLTNKATIQSQTILKYLWSKEDWLFCVYSFVVVDELIIFYTSWLR